MHLWGTPRGLITSARILSLTKDIEGQARVKSGRYLFLFFLDVCLFLFSFFLFLSCFISQVAFSRLVTKCLKYLQFYVQLSIYNK